MPYVGHSDLPPFHCSRHSSQLKLPLESDKWKDIEFVVVSSPIPTIGNMLGNSSAAIQYLTAALVGLLFKLVLFIKSKASLLQAFFNFISLMISKPFNHGT